MDVYYTCAHVHFLYVFMYLYTAVSVMYHIAGIFQGGKSFVISEFLASSWNNFRGRGILSHTPVLCGTVSWIKIS